MRRRRRSREALPARRHRRVTDCRAAAPLAPPRNGRWVNVCHTVAAFPLVSPVEIVWTNGKVCLERVFVGRVKLGLAQVVVVKAQARRVSFVLAAFVFSVKRGGVMPARSNTRGRELWALWG